MYSEKLALSLTSLFKLLPRSCYNNERTHHQNKLKQFMKEYFQFSNSTTYVLCHEKILILNISEIAEKCENTGAKKRMFVHK